jgi:hypothetical protein
MVTMDRINSDYTIYYDEQAQLYRAMCNKCGGSDAGSNADKSTVQQAVVNLVQTLGGGTIFLKAMTLDDTVTFDDRVLIIEDHQGKRTYYRSNQRLFEVGDLVQKLP